jgi:hypothetical protein
MPSQASPDGLESALSPRGVRSKADNVALPKAHDGRHGIPDDA